MNLNLDRSAWKRVVVRDVMRHITDRVDAETSGLERFLAGEHIPGGSLAITDWGVIGRDPIGPMFYKRFEPGQVLYVSRRTYLRKVAVPEFEGITGEKTFVLETVDPAVLLQEFLPFVMSAERFHSYAIANSRGSVNPYLNWGELAAYEFNLPPIDVQKRVAELLWVTEGHRRALRDLDAELTKTISTFCFEAFKQLSAAYPRTSFAQLGELAMGRQKAPKYMTGEGSTPYLRVANIGSLDLDLTVVEEMDFNERELAKYRLQSGDVLLTEGDIVSAFNVGRPALYDDNLPICTFQNTLIRFRPRKDSDSRYFVALFEGMRGAGVFAKSAGTTTVSHIGLKRLSAVPIPDVPLEVQTQIGSRLQALLSARSKTAVSRGALVDLRSTLSAEIFGGK
jgi:type I restriction enzyme, S subunit